MKIAPGNIFAPANQYLEKPGEKWRTLAIWALICIPLLSLALNALSWLRYGLDLPIYDDWRAYSNQTAGSLAIEHLFQSTHDTLYPVGMALDALAQRHLNGNAVAYQFLSMLTVLGLLLYLQWKLLSLALRDTLLAASAFSLTLLMLQPGSYWGVQSLAYHHALPLVFCLAALYLMLTRKETDLWTLPVLFALGILSGMSYISGAFAATAIGIIVLVAGRFIPSSERRPMIKGALSFLSAAIITLVPQTWVIVGIQKGVYRPGASMSLPTESDFWLFLLGKIARSLMLPSKTPLLSIIVTVLLVLAVSSLSVWLIRKFISGKMQGVAEARSAVVFLSLAGAVFVYLLLVAAGRANYRPPGVEGSIAIFTDAFRRFHFFWMTLLWPWLAAVCFEAIAGKNSRNPRKYLPLYAVLIPAVLLPLFISAGALKHRQWYRERSNHGIEAARCLQSEMRKGQGINCPELHPQDLARPFTYGKSIGASFGRFFPYAHIPLGTEDPAPLFRLSQAGFERMDMRNMDLIERQEAGYRLRGAKGPMILFKTGSPEVLRQCMTLEITLLMQAPRRDEARLFYKTPWREEFSGKSSVTAAVPARKDKPAEICFELSSASGFLDDFRLDPVTKPQPFEFLNMEVRCRMFPNENAPRVDSSTP